MTTPLQITRYDRLVRRAMNLVGEGAIVTGVLPDVFPIIDLENIPIELRPLAGWTEGVEGTTFTSAALEFPTIQVFNPAASGKLVVVEAFQMSSSTTGVFRASFGTTARTFFQFFKARDTRQDITIDLSTEMRVESLVAVIDQQAHWRMLANTAFSVQPPGGVGVLFPGAGFEVSLTGAASTLDVTMWVRERPFDAAEDTR